MGESNLLYLIPPIVSIYLATCLAIISVYKSKRALNFLFSLLCFAWVLSSTAQIAHLFTSTTEKHILIERLTHAFYCFSPLIHVLFFHKLMAIRRRKLSIALLCISSFFSLLTFTDFYIYGLREFNWGHVAIVGPGFFFLLFYSGCVLIYIVSCAAATLIYEQNHILKLKLKYALISVLSAYTLTIFNTLPLIGYDLYPLGNFIFIPLLFLAYGILRYRILNIKSVLYIIFQYCLEFALLALANMIILISCRDLIKDIPVLILGIAGSVWFYINYYYKTQARRFINFIFNESKTRLNKAENKFIENILLLKDIDGLIEQFIKVLDETLKLTLADFFIMTPTKDCFQTTKGKQLETDSETINWFIKTKHLIEKNMVSTNPYYDSCREQLLKIFNDHNCSVIIPMVQYDELVGIALFKSQTTGVTRDEVQFINNIKQFVVIALYNSITYQNITTLKETLEEKTEKLSTEIIERQRAEDVLIESEARYRLLAENITDTIWVIDLADLTLNYISPSVKKLLNYTTEELTGSQIQKLLSPDSLKKVNKEIKKALNSDKRGQAKSIILNIELIKKDNTIVCAEFSTYFIRNANEEPISIIGVARDISERLNAEEEKSALESKLRQAQKMESIGILAGGIAHDFNNILMAILGYTQLAIMYIPDKIDNAIEKIKQIESAGKRAKELVAQILAFSRQSSQQKMSINIATLVSESVMMLSASIPSTIEIIKDFQEDLKPAFVDPIQIHQIIINLCTNAYHAMEKDGGKCHVRLSNKSINNEQAKLLEISPGDYLEIVIIDTGKGIEAEILDRIFDPYFTTKEIGRGTGMGLAMVHGIVMSHNGAITVESEVCVGTTFKIVIPAGEKVETGKSVTTEPPSSGKERILYVDDEEILVELTGEALKSLGYEITATTSPNEAMKLLTEAPDSFDIVITDFTMPEMTGDILAEEIHKIRSDIPIILCTGYKDPITSEEKLCAGITEILQKPLSLKDLTAAIREVLSK